MRKMLGAQTVIAGCIICMTMPVLNAQAVVTATWNPAGTATDQWSDSVSWSTGTVPEVHARFYLRRYPQDPYRLSRS